MTDSTQRNIEGLGTAARLKLTGRADETLRSQKRRKASRKGHYSHATPGVRKYSGHKTNLQAVSGLRVVALSPWTARRRRQRRSSPGHSGAAAAKRGAAHQATKPGTSRLQQLRLGLQPHRANRSPGGRGSAGRRPRGSNPGPRGAAKPEAAQQATTVPRQRSGSKARSQQAPAAQARSSAPSSAPGGGTAPAAAGSGTARRWSLRRAAAAAATRTALHSH